MTLLHCVTVRGSFVSLLQEASTLADLDSGNMEKKIQDENVTLYVWANLKKNPRYSPPTPHRHGVW